MRPRFVPIDVITFAAKTGFITKAIFYEFFAKGCERTKRRQWRNLVNAGWMEPHPSPICSGVLVLARASRGLSASTICDEVRPVYVGLLHHDETLARIVLEMERQGLIQAWTTEAEMKRLGSVDLRLSGSRLNTKYPDALITLSVPGASIKVALELELSRKSKRRYEDVAFAYMGLSEVKAVFFVCGRREIIETIKAAFRRAHYPVHEKLVGFMLAHEWSKDPAHAALEMPARVTTFSNLVSEVREKRRTVEREKVA